MSRRRAPAHRRGATAERVRGALADTVDRGFPPGPWVLVVGMHRSGTSALAGALGQLGLIAARPRRPGDRALRQPGPLREPGPHRCRRRHPRRARRDLERPSCSSRRAGSGPGAVLGVPVAPGMPPATAFPSDGPWCGRTRACACSCRGGGRAPTARRHRARVARPLSPSPGRCDHRQGFTVSLGPRPVGALQPPGVSPHWRATRSTSCATRSCSTTLGPRSTPWPVGWPTPGWTGADPCRR